MSKDLSISFTERVAQRLGFNLQPTPLEETLCLFAQITISPNLRTKAGAMPTAAAIGMALVPDIAELVGSYGIRMGQKPCIEKAKDVKQARNAFYSRVAIAAISAGALYCQGSAAAQQASKVVAAVGAVYATWAVKRLYETTSSLRATIDRMGRF